MSSIIKDAATIIFIVCVGIFTLVAILGVWNVLGSEVIGKSVATIAIVAFVSLVAIATGQFLDKKPN